MVSEETTVLYWDLLGPFQHQSGDLLELSTELVIRKCTYYLPIGTCLGLTSADLNAAKNSSQGAAS